MGEFHDPVHTRDGKISTPHRQIAKAEDKKNGDDDVKKGLQMQALGGVGGGGGFGGTGSVLGVNRSGFAHGSLFGFDISFNTKEFQSVKHIIYEYKFAKDKDWTVLREEVDFVKFINLAPGNYIFQLRAKNKFSKNYSKTIELNFEVLAPIYQRWWFILIGFLLILSFHMLYSLGNIYW